MDLQCQRLLIAHNTLSTLNYCNSILSPKTAVSSKWGCTGYRTKTEIRPNHLNTSRRFALAACGIANPFQAVHACVQVSSWDCFGIYRRDMYATLF